MFSNKLASFLFLCVPVLVIPVFSHGQSAKNLEKANGFKNYKLNSKYTSVNGAKSKVGDGTDVVTITYCPDKIGDIPVSKIYLYYVSDSLAKIKVFVMPYNYEKLLTACRSNFGAPSVNLSHNKETELKDSSLTQKGTTYLDCYQWKSGKVVMSYNYTYPRIDGNPYAERELSLVYQVSDFDARLKRTGAVKYKSSDF